MGKYSPLYCLRLEHDYYVDKRCRSIHVQVNSSSVDLLRRRGLIFKQTGVNEWCVLSTCLGQPYVGEDVLLLDLYLSDPAFAYYTEWKDYSPAKMYNLNLPNANSEFTAIVNGETKKLDIGSKFCTAKLKLNNDQFKGKTVENTLKFHSKKAHWEYVLIPRGEHLQPDKELTIVEKAGKIQFSKPAKKMYGNREAWFVKSEEALPLFDYYHYNLSVVTVATPPEVLITLPYPVPGRFLKSKAELMEEAGSPPRTAMIREVCYYEL